MVNRDVFPPYNLPDEAVPWGREAQKRIIAGENSEVQLSQKVDNGLRATAGQLSVMSEQVGSLSRTVNFLASQISSDSRDSFWQHTIDPAQGTPVVLEPFDSEFDVELTVQAPESGKIKVDISAELTAFALSSPDRWVRFSTRVIVYFRKLGGSSFISSGASIAVGVASGSGGQSSENVVSVSGGAVVHGLEPGESYEFVSLRAHSGEVSPTGTGGSQSGAVRRASLTLTKLY